MNAHPLTPTERIARWRQRVLDTIHAARLTHAIEPPVQPQTDSALLARSGWRALHEHEFEMAGACFRAALHHDPYSVSAWVGLSRVVEEREQRRTYLQAALDLHFLLTDTLERTR